jgi:hypothetical protein
MTDHTPGPDWDDEPALLEELGSALGHDPSATPPPERVEAVRAAARAMDAGRHAHRPRGSARRTFLTGGIAAGVGGIAGYLASESRDAEPAPQAAVPMEQVAFDLTDSSAAVTTSALINHTWGTELVLDVTGLTAGTAYAVVYETVRGEVAAGSLLAVADVLMKCRFQAAPLRADVRAIELRDPAGRAVLRSELPTRSA